MATKHRTKADNSYLSAIAQIGCIACLVQGTPGTPGEIHHIREGQGKGQRADHRESICLCPAHHRGTMHPQIPSIHMDKHKFIAEFGTEAELLQRTQKELGHAHD